MERCGGVAAIALDTTENTARQGSSGVSRWGGYFGRVAKKVARKTRKGCDKRSETSPNSLSLSLAAYNHLTGTSLEFFHRPKFAQFVVFLLHRDDVQGWPR